MEMMMGNKNLTTAARILGSAGGKSRASTLSKAQSSAIAKQGGKTGGRGRKKKKS